MQIYLHNLTANEFADIIITAGKFLCTIHIFCRGSF